MGLGAKEGTSNYVESGAGSYLTSDANAGMITHLIDLDTYVDRYDVPRIDYIKLDIEGAELDCLHGAMKSIIRWKPKLAICAYHKTEDFWSLAQYINSLRPDYEFAFRHYRIEEKPGGAVQKVRHQLNLSPNLTTDWELVLYCR